MKRKLLLSTFIFIGFLSTINSQSNLFIDNSYTVQEMVMDFFDNPNIVVSNITSNADPNSFAFFDAGGTGLGVDAGIIMSTGNVLDALGPNVQQGTSGSIGAPGDADLDQMLPGFPTFDAPVIEFDFTVTQTDTLHFNYVFGSEEYDEFVNSQFNDVFGFFISGPGITGPFSNNAESISMIPSSNLPVAINNVNLQLNANYYISNMGGQHVEFDGYTTPLPASFFAVAGEIYHIKIVIGDAADTVYDSGIFLSFNSLGQDSLLVPPSEFEFSVNSSSVDFTNTSKYARTWNWDFGNGELSSERNPGTINYSTPGDYTVTLVTENYCCTDTYTTTVTIEESIPLAINVTTANNPLNCFGDMNAEINVEVTGGTPPYNIQGQIGTPLGAGTYSILVVDANGLFVDATIEITQPAEIILLGNSTPATGNNADGTATVGALVGTGGVILPLSYLWSNGSTNQTNEGLVAGDYDVTVTNGHGCTAMTTVTVESVTSVLDNNDFEISLFPNPVKDQLRLSWNEFSTIQQVNIYDVLGRIVPVNYELINNGIEIRFNQTLVNGTYFLQIELEDGKKASSRFIAE